MKYLLYFLDGFAKKFPLNKSTITIGRGEENDLIIDDDFMSREHVNVWVAEKSLRIKDHGSSNGTFVNGERIDEATIEMGESFSTGRMEFFLRRGSLDEFETAGELNLVFKRMRNDNETKIKAGKTKKDDDIHTEVLKTIMKKGLGSRDFNTFITSLSQILTGAWQQTGFAVISMDSSEFRVHMMAEGSPDFLDLLNIVRKEHDDLFDRDVSLKPLGNTPFFVQSFPFAFGDSQYALVAVTRQKTGHKKAEKFFSVLSSELKLLTHLLGSDTKTPPKKITEEDLGVNIVAGNPGMRRLIEQAKKFAQSDIFILIQGESGTGKELFARLMHQHSRRAKGEFVALNCAAIPENLLESELFGYEKGAFTGADRPRKGKLELSSGGTLVLDEIGNMPLDLQMKLLRAVQEQEFYRLGGSTQIKVDLRIISITNEDLKKMVAAGTFRKDLYYRLVHRMMVIPPLRERREDIPVLINHFTNQFCALNHKQINGYTVKAFSALQNHDWDGNVRELENEINVLVNLADDAGSIDFDMLSESIKRGSDEEVVLSVLSPPKLDEKSETESLIRLLEQNGWNKSQTARKMGMTYRGLHEKMKRMGIQRPARG